MSNFVVGGGKPSNGLQIGKSSVPAIGSKSGGLLGGLQAIHKNASAIVEFKQKPVLIYLIVDLTGSREDTRAAMKKHEKDLAMKIRALGNERPIVCKGVYHRGGSSSAPIELKDADAISKFFDIEPSAGGTNIAPGLTHYLNDKTDSIISLGILIGDSDDGDIAKELVTISKKLADKSRPVIVAYENTGDSDFCYNVAPAIATASEGISFQLSKYPEELNILLGNLSKLLSATPDQLKSQSSASFSGFNFGGNSDTRNLSSRMAERLMLTGPK